MKMKKVLIIFLLATIATLTIATSVLFANSETTLTAHLVNFRILVNGEDRNFTYPIVVINDRTYVPLREVGEALNMDVKWCAEDRKISITSNHRNNGAFERPSASEGILSTGIQYVFVDTDFNVNYFIEQNLFDISWDIDSKVIAKTPKEVAEKGQYYLHPSFRDRDPNSPSNLGIKVRYCGETDSWVLQLFFPNRDESDPPIVGGTPGILVVNRSNGNVMYHVSPFV